MKSDDAPHRRVDVAPDDAPGVPLRERPNDEPPAGDTAPDDAAGVPGQERPIDEPPAGDAAPGERQVVSSRVAWAVAAVLLAAIVLPITWSDFRDRPVIGDQSTFLLAAISITDDFDLWYDAGDVQNWRDVGWDRYDFPITLFSRHVGEDAWSFAKPFGYSYYLAPFLAVFSTPRAIAVANAALVTALAVLVALILRRRYSSPVTPIAAFAFVGASYAYAYGYVIHTEVFLAVVTAAFALAALLAADKGRLAPAMCAGAIAAFMVTEKLVAGVAFLPVLAVVAWSLPSWRRRGAVAAAYAASLAVFLFPYWYFSRGTSLTPYSGERYWETRGPAFVDTSLAVPVNAGSEASVGKSIDAVFTNPADKAESLLYYFVGRHTGMLVFIPAALVFLILATVRIRSSRNPLSIAALLGVAAYVAFYVLRFTQNYYGGSHSLGNRYFLQIAPLAVLALVAAEVPWKQVMWGSVAAIVIGVTMIWPHLLDPENAYGNIARTTSIQRLLPAEKNQWGYQRFSCNFHDCAGFDDP